MRKKAVFAGALISLLLFTTCGISGLESESEWSLKRHSAKPSGEGGSYYIILK
jgi:hypothetical protein